MKKLALGLVAAATICTAMPAMAQVGVYAGPGGVGVQVGPPDRAYYDNGYYNNAYPGYGTYDYYNGPAVVVHPHGWDHRHWHR